MLTSMPFYGRITACHASSEYDTSSNRVSGVPNSLEIIVMRLQVRGMDFAKQFPEVVGLFLKSLADGKIRAEGAEQRVRQLCGHIEDVVEVL